MLARGTCNVHSTRRQDGGRVEVSSFAPISRKSGNFFSSNRKQRNLIDSIMERTYKTDTSNPVQKLLVPDPESKGAR